MSYVGLGGHMGVLVLLVYTMSLHGEAMMGRFLNVQIDIVGCDTSGFSLVVSLALKTMLSASLGSASLYFGKPLVLTRP